MKSFGKLLIVLAAVLTLALVIGLGCKGKEQPPTGKAQPVAPGTPAAKAQAPAAATPAPDIEKMKVRVGISPVISSSAFYLGQIRGYFQEYGLEVDLTGFGKSGAGEIPLLASGDLDVAGGSIAPAVYRAIADGTKIKIVADKARIDTKRSHTALMLRKELITSGRWDHNWDVQKKCQALKGMKIAFTSPGYSNVYCIGMDRYLNKCGLSIKDIDLIGIEYPNQMAALKEGSLDGSAAIEPFMTSFQDQNLAEIAVDWKEVMPNFQVAVVYYGEQFMKEHPVAAKNFMIGYVKGLRDYINAFEYGIDQEKVIEDLISVMKVKEKSLYPRMAVTKFNPDGYVDIPTLKEAQDWFAQADPDNLPQKVNVDDIVDNSYCDYAVQKLGKFQPPK